MSMPRCNQIFRHWQYKGITEKGEISDTGGIPVVENPYLPQCWACGIPANRRNFLSWDKYDRAVEEIWQDKCVNNKLNRCHVVAKQFGGADDPDNLFLLCEDCHVESPDTRNREAFFRWVYRRRKDYSYGIPVFKLMDEAVAEIRARGYEPVDFAAKLRGLTSDELSATVMGSFEKCGLHGTAIANASVVVAVVDALEQKVNSPHL